MIIKSIEIEGFGKFSGYTLNLKKGFNLILGGNEYGKTTLMAFVKMMFYSSSSKTEKASDLFKSLRKKYRPFNGSPMLGTIEFEFDGMDFRMQKEFLKSEATDKTTIFCKTTGENFEIGNKNEAGEYFFGMKLDEFERSIFIGENGGFSADSSSDSLAMRVSNLTVSGDENISHQTILKRLSDALEELISKSGKKGILAEETKKLEDLKFEEQQLVQLEKEQSSLEAYILKLKTEIVDIEDNLSRISESQSLEAAKKELNALYALHNKQNLLNAVKVQLSSYDAPEADLRTYIQKANALSDKIDEKLIRIQEITSATSQSDVSDDEFLRLLSLEETTAKLRSDISVLEGKVQDLDNRLKLDMLSATKVKRLISFVPILLAVLISGFIYFSNILPLQVAVSSLSLGLIITAIMFFTSKKRAQRTLSARLLVRDIEEAVRSLSCFEEAMLQKSLDDILDDVKSLLQDSVSELSEGLSRHHSSNISELRKKSTIAKTEDIKKINEELSADKESFIALATTIKNSATYSAAKILYVELCESLKSLDSLTAEINTLSDATGILDASPQFVDNRIKELGDIIHNSTHQENFQNISPAELRTKLQQKRAELDEYQRKIIIPSRSLNEVRRLIGELEEKCAELNNRYKEISLAIDIINQSILEVNKGLGSKLGEKVSKYLSKISSDRFHDVLVPRDLSIEVRGNAGESYHEWKYMSESAISRIYLALRLAMTDIIAQNQNGLPLFFDDILSGYDDEGVRLALEFLKDYLDTSNSVSQMVFFTCHESIAKMAKEIFGE